MQKFSKIYRKGTLKIKFLAIFFLSKLLKVSTRDWVFEINLNKLILYHSFVNINFSCLKGENSDIDLGKSDLLIDFRKSAII